MKKLYLFLLTAILALGSSFTAEAAVGKITWNYPGAVKIFKWSNLELLEQSVAEDALEFDIPEYSIDYLVEINPGYTVADCIMKVPDGSTRTLNPGKPWGYTGDSSFYTVRVWEGDYGTTVTINLVSDEEANKEGTLTLNIENGADLLNFIGIGNTNMRGLTNGSHTITFKPAVEKKIQIWPYGGKHLYSVKHNGVEAEELDNWGSKYYELTPLADGDVITIRGYEEDQEIKTYKVTIDIPEDAKGAIASVYNRSLLKNLEPEADGTYTVNEGTILSIRFNEDYDVNSVTANGESIPVNDGMTGVIIINEDTNIKIDAKPKTYYDITWTVYITDPAGVTVHAGKGNEGFDLELKNGELTTEPITFSANGELSGFAAQSITIPAGGATKYTFSVTSKYPTLMYLPKAGYWIKSTRAANLKDEAEIPVTSNTFYILDQKIDRSAQAAVYLSTNGAGARLNGNSLTLAPGIDIPKQGYNMIKFDPEFDAPFGARFADNSVLSPTVYVDNIAATPDENGIYEANIKDGSIIKMFGDGKTHTLNNISVVKNKWTSAEITYDKFKTADASFEAFDGTEVVIKAAAKTGVLVDGNALTPANDGATYTFNTTGAHTITLAYDGSAPDEYTLTPEAGSTLESLSTITIAFPYAKEVTTTGEADEIIIRSDDFSAFAIASSIEKTDATVPTFEITFSPAPTRLTTYKLIIPEAFFKIDGEDSPQIMPEYTLDKDLSDIEINYEPAENINISMPYFGVIFPEELTIEMSDEIGEKLSLKFNDTLLEPGTDFEISEGEPNMFILALTNREYCKPGSLTLEIAEGGLLMSGKPAPAISHTWTIVDPKAYTLSPESGSTAEDLSTIIVAFPYAETVTQALENDEIQFKTNDNTWAAVSLSIETVEAEVPTFAINVTPVPTKNTNYQLNIPEGFFKIDGEDSNEIDATFTLSRETELEILFDPEGEIVVKEYPIVNIIFTDQTVRVKDGSKITVKFDDTVLAANDYMYNTEDTFFMLMIQNSDYFKAGTLTIELAEGALSLSGKDSPAISHSWTFVAVEKEYNVVITPSNDNTVTDLSTITITFNGAKTVSIWYEFAVRLNGMNSGNYFFSNATLEVVEGAEVPTVKATFDPAPKDKGEYTLAIWYDAFGIDDLVSYPVDTIEFDYTLDPTSGIDGILVEDEIEGDIYNLQGVKLTSKWADLPAGLYIVNGQKLIKK